MDRARKIKGVYKQKLFELVSKNGHQAFLLLIEALFQNQLDSIADKLLTYVAAQSSEQSFIALPSSPLAGKNDVIECNICMNDKKSVTLNRYLFYAKADRKFRTKYKINCIPVQILHVPVHVLCSVRSEDAEHI